MVASWPDAIRRAASGPLETPPPFIQVDFALCADPAGLPSFQLIELQAFPSILATMYMVSSWQQAHFPLSRARCTPAALPLADVIPLVRDCILAGHAEEEVALLEVQPAQQPTYHDLLAHQHLFGIAIEDLADVTHAEDLARPASLRGRNPAARYRRLYNRVVFEEAEQHGLSLHLAELLSSGVSWASHPLWYFLVSKAVLPLLRHPSAPPALLCTAPEARELDLSEWCLKPLYSFGGRGVQVVPAGSALRDLPAEERDHWLLQKRVQYAPLVQTPAGRRFVELRVMLMWKRGEPSPQVGLTFFRMNTEPRHNISQMLEPFTGGGMAWFQDEDS